MLAAFEEIFEETTSFVSKAMHALGDMNLAGGCDTWACRTSLSLTPRCVLTPADKWIDQAAHVT
jgi:hypothetical protein